MAVWIPALEAEDRAQLVAWGSEILARGETNLADVGWFHVFDARIKGGRLDLLVHRHTRWYRSLLFVWAGFGVATAFIWMQGKLDWIQLWLGLGLSAPALLGEGFVRFCWRRHRLRNRDAFLKREMRAGDSAKGVSE